MKKALIILGVTAVVVGVGLWWMHSKDGEQVSGLNNEDNSNAREAHNDDETKNYDEDTSEPQELTGDPIPGIDITVNQAPGGKNPPPPPPPPSELTGDPIPGIDITVNQGHLSEPSDASSDKEAAQTEDSGELKPEERNTNGKTSDVTEEGR